MRTPGSRLSLLERALTALAVTIAALLFVRLGGAAREWLSPLGLLAALIIVVAVRTLLVPALASSFVSGAAWRAWLQRHQFAVGLAGVVGLTFLIRLPHLNADLGHVPLDIDEGRLASNIRDYFITGRIGHDTVEHYPGVVFWMMSGASLLAYLRALLDGSIHTITDTSPEMFAAAARVVNVAIAAATVAAIALLGRHLAGPAAGLIAAFVFATVRMSVDTTTMVRNDPGQVLFLVLAVYAALVAARSEQWRWAVAAGALAGVATGIKYTSVLVLVSVLTAMLLNGSWPSRLSKLFAAVLAFVVATAVTNHFLWTDFPNFLRQLSDQVRVSREGSSPNPAAFYAETLGTIGPGWPLLLLAVGYGAHGLGTGRRDAWVFWSFPILYSWFTAHSLTQFVRWVLPLLPFASVAGAAALTAVASAVADWDGWQRKSIRALRPTVTALVVVAGIATPLWAGVVNISRRSSTPTYEVVETWLRERTGDDAVLVEYGHLKFAPSVRVRRVPSVRDVLRGGMYGRLLTRWIVVPEFDKNAAAGLRELTLELRVIAGQGFGGNTGLDYDVYSTVELPRTARGEELRLGDHDAALFLGHEWDTNNNDGPGLDVPPGGAALFLPPVTWQDVRVELEVTAGSAPEPPIDLTIDGIPLELTSIGTPGATTRLSGVVRLLDPAHVTPLRVTPRDARAVRALRFSFAEAIRCTSPC